MRRMMDILLLPACIAMLSYFAWTYFHGNRSVAAYAVVELRIAELEKNLNGLRQTREKQDQRVGLLRAQNLDPDMLEERARDSLQYVGSGEFVIYMNGLNQ